MIRIAFTADNQVDEASRLAEHDRVMTFVAEEAHRLGCDLMLHGGDLFERRSTVVERASVELWLDACHPMPVVVAGGNHETRDEVDEQNCPPAVWGLERPEMLDLAVPLVAGASLKRVLVAVLPWPRREWLLQQLGVGVSPADADAAAVEALREILRGFCREFEARDPEHVCPRILLAHADVTGGKTGPDQPDVARGMMIGPTDLGLAGADAVCLGHLHMPQELDVPGAQWAGYAGSPRRTSYSRGEALPKSFVVLEFDGPSLRDVMRVPTPATPMLLVEGAFDLESETVQLGDVDLGILCPEIGADRVAGAEIRVRYSVDADQREVAKRSADELRERLLALGAAEVKIDPVVAPATRARAPEVAAATTMTDKLCAYWTATGQVADPERRERLCRLVDSLRQ